jgi:hypothetical protein
MLPVSVDPRAKMKITSLHGPRVSSFATEPVAWRSTKEDSTKEDSTRAVSGTAMGLARTTEARARITEKRILMVVIDLRKRRRSFLSSSLI